MKLILLRGLGRDALHWKTLLTALKKIMPDVEIVTPDLPGAGCLYDIKSPKNIEAYPSFLERQLIQITQKSIQALQEEEWCVIGLSLGGMVALQWASNRPKLFKKIILMNTSSRLNPVLERFRLFEVLKKIGLFKVTDVEQREEAIYQLTCHKQPMEKQLISDWVAIQNKHPVSFTNIIRQLHAASRFSLPKEEFLPPIHVLFSETDSLVSKECSLSIIDYYHATYDCHPWAGHDLPQDDPEWVAEKVKAVL